MDKCVRLFIKGILIGREVVRIYVQEMTGKSNVYEIKTIFGNTFSCGQNYLHFAELDRFYDSIFNFDKETKQLTEIMTNKNLNFVRKFFGDTNVYIIFGKDEILKVFRPTIESDHVKKYPDIYEPIKVPSICIPVIKEFYPEVYAIQNPKNDRLTDKQTIEIVLFPHTIAETMRKL